MRRPNDSIPTSCPWPPHSSFFIRCFLRSPDYFPTFRMSFFLASSYLVFKYKCSILTLTRDDAYVPCPQQRQPSNVLSYTHRLCSKSNAYVESLAIPLSSHSARIYIPPNEPLRPSSNGTTPMIVESRITQQHQITKRDVLSFSLSLSLSHPFSAGLPPHMMV